MTMTVREYEEMGREGFIDAMLAELAAKAQNPRLSPDERERLRAYYERTRRQIEARRARQDAELRKAA